MVLVSNEWQNKTEDVPKTTENTTTTAVTYTTTVSSSSNTSAAACIPDSSETIPETGTKIYTKNDHYKTETIVEDFINSITDPVISTSSITTGSATKILNTNLPNDNSNNEQINEIIKNKHSIDILYKNELNDGESNECKIAQVENLFTTAKQLKEEDNLAESVLNYSNSVKIMAENNKESPQKREKEEEEEQESHPQSLINNHYAGCNKDLDESNSCLSSDTSTLTTAQIIFKAQQNNRQQNIIKQQHQQGPVTQSGLNATNANNTHISGAAAGLQPNFLSQLALTANVAGLKKTTTTTTSIFTAKELNQPFNLLDSSNQSKSDSNLLEGITSTGSVPAVTYDNNGQAKIILICEGNSHPFQTRTICLTPNVECMVGRLIAKSKASENNAIFDCKVLSRKHAVIWYTSDGKFWVKDTKSSNGTFINDNKLGDEEAELHFGDIVKFGVDVLENSRKEVHGCIIACVKLYLPDGREAISFDSSGNRSQYSGEGRISYDELHRLNLYMQETSQREKVLTSKLCNIQNVLDATRKNSALCWQSMITEDQLLHRIHTLEKKLQFMEKNVPENILRNEVLKLLDDKSSYQHTAKEALRKVYQERCDAMQMLAKIESAYTQSDNECSVLRDQIMNSKQTLQDVNSRLLRLETEYNEYKDEVTRQQQEAKDCEEQRITELMKKLRERELECEDLKKKISELLVRRAELLEHEEQLLEKQAIEKLDAAIADMDLGGDEDSSDENENNVLEVKEMTNNEDSKIEDNAVGGHNEDTKLAIITKKPSIRPHMASIFVSNLRDVDEKHQQDQSKLKKDKVLLDMSTDKSPLKRVRETTIMKWLQNSDLNKNEASFDIFKAICNENDDEDFDECSLSTDHELNCTKALQMQDCGTMNENNVLSNFTSKLKNVQKNLKELEAEIQKETKNDESSDDDDTDDAKDGACAEEEFIIKRNGNTSTPSGNEVLSKDNKKYHLLKSSVNMLRDAYNEIWDSVREQSQSEQYDRKENVLSINDKVNTELQTLRSCDFDNTESDSEVESLTLSSPVNSSSLSVTVVDLKSDTANKHQLLKQLEDYQSQVDELNKKLQQTELEAQHTLEIMQVECDDAKLKMENLNKIIQVLNNDKKALEQIIKENQNNQATCETLLSNYKSITEVSKESNAHLEKELELEDDPMLNAINVTALEREEELITYKERLDEQQKENIVLRNEISLLKLKTNAGTTRDLLFKQYLPCSVIILAIIIYFVTTYF